MKKMSILWRCLVPISILHFYVLVLRWTANSVHSLHGSLTLGKSPYLTSLSLYLTGNMSLKLYPWQPQIQKNHTSICNPVIYKSVLKCIQRSHVKAWVLAFSLMAILSKPSNGNDIEVIKDFLMCQIWTVLPTILDKLGVNMFLIKAMEPSLSIQA